IFRGHFRPGNQRHFFLCEVLEAHDPAIAPLEAVVFRGREQHQLVTSFARDGHWFAPRLLGKGAELLFKLRRANPHTRDLSGAAGPSITEMRSLPHKAGTAVQGNPARACFLLRTFPSGRADNPAKRYRRPIIKIIGYTIEWETVTARTESLYSR